MATSTESGSARELLAIGDADCWGLLAGQRLGRLAYTVDALPAVVPVRFTARSGEVIIAAVLGSEVHVASRGDVVALEADEVDVEACTGWSVTAVGPTRPVRDPHLALQLRADGLEPWAPTALTTYFVIDVQVITGRRLVAVTRA